MKSTISTTTTELIDTENNYLAHNYASIPVVIERGLGSKLWDVDGDEYFDFLAGYSSLNQGHLHPRIIKALMDQATKITMTSRAFHNNLLPGFAKFITSYFDQKYDKVLMMNSGVEACETAVKLARRWGYEKKEIPYNHAKVIFAEHNFWGRTIAACSASTDPECFNGYGPFVPGFEVVPFDDICALEDKLKDPRTCAFMVEPVQGEGGVRVPTAGYLLEVRRLCTKYEVLLICDEVQSGLGRTGKMLACDHEGVRPDILILGKALSGGVMPVSAVLADDEVMLLIRPGQHGSTYGGNPMACAVAKAALQVIKDENLCERSQKLGTRLRMFLEDQKDRHAWIVDVRGVGLFSGITVNPKIVQSADAVCKVLQKYRVLAKGTREVVVRFTPPLVIKQDELEEALRCISDAFDYLSSTLG